MLILSLSTWVSACGNSLVRVKPDGALTVPMEKQERDEVDTVRTLLENQAIDEGNKRFQKIRE